MLRAAHLQRHHRHRLFAFARSISAVKDALAVAPAAAVRANGHVADVRLVEHEPHARVGQHPAVSVVRAPASAPRRSPSRRAGWIPPTMASRSRPSRFRESAFTSASRIGRIIGSAHALLPSRAARSRSACGARRYSGRSVRCSSAASSPASSRRAASAQALPARRPLCWGWQQNAPLSPSRLRMAVFKAGRAVAEEQRDLRPSPPRGQGTASASPPCLPVRRSPRFENRAVNLLGARVENRADHAVKRRHVRSQRFKRVHRDAGLTRRVCQRLHRGNADTHAGERAGARPPRRIRPYPPPSCRSFASAVSTIGMTRWLCVCLCDQFRLVDQPAVGA